MGIVALGGTAVVCVLLYATEALFEVGEGLPVVGGAGIIPSSESEADRETDRNPVITDAREAASAEDPSGGGDAAIAPRASEPTTPAAPKEQAPRPQFPVLALPRPATGIAFAPEASQLAVAGVFENRLAIYAASDLPDGEPTLVDVGGMTTAVAAKRLDGRQLFVVGVAVPPRLILVDAELGSIVGQIVVTADEPPTYLTGSESPDSPYLFFVTGMPGRDLIRRVDLRRREEAGLIDTAVAADGFRASPDGRAVHLWRRHGTESGVLAVDGPAVDPEFAAPARAFLPGRPTYLNAGLGGPVRPHPSGRFLAAAKQVVSSDLAAIRFTAEFEPQTFFATAPWFAGLENGSQLCVGSLNGGRTVAKAALPAEVAAELNAPIESDREPPRVREMFADERNDQLLLATSRHVVRLPLAGLRLPDEPLLTPGGVLPEDATVGRPLRIEPVFPEGVEAVRLGKHPDGVRLSGRAIEWTPGPRHLGEQTIEVVTAGGGVEHVEPWRVRVDYDSVETQFRVTSVSLSADGRTAVAVGRAPGGPKQDVPSSSLAVIDVPRGEVVASRDLGVPINGVAVRDDDLFVLTYGRLGRFSAKTLESEDQVVVGDERVELVPADRRLAVIRMGGIPDRFELPTLEPIPEFALGMQPREGWLAGRTGFGWLWDGVLWDHDAETPLLLLWPYAFRRDDWSHRQLAVSGGKSRVYFKPGQWHPVVMGGEVRAVSGPRTPLRHLHGPTPDIPWAVGVDEADGGVTVVAFDEHDGTVHGQARVLPARPATTPPPLPGSTSLDGKASVATSRETLAVYRHHDRRVFFFPLSALGELPRPFHVVPRQSAFVLPLEGEETVRYQAEGATEFQLESEELGGAGEPYRAESATGEFTISAAGAVERRVEEYAMFLANLAQDRSSDYGDRVDDYMKSAGQEFERLLGRKPRGVPIPIRVFVTAKGKDFRMAVLTHDFLVEVPRARLINAMEKKYGPARRPAARPANPQTPRPRRSASSPKSDAQARP